MKEFGLFSDSWLLFLRKVRIEKDYVKKGIRQLEVMDFQAIVGVIQCCGIDFKLDVDQENPLGGGTSSETSKPSTRTTMEFRLSSSCNACSSTIKRRSEQNVRCSKKGISRLASSKFDVDHLNPLGGLNIGDDNAEYKDDFGIPLVIALQRLFVDFDRGLMLYAINGLALPNVQKWRILCEVCRQDD